MIYPEDFINKIICGDCLKIIKYIPDNSIDLIVTSPPYWGLRDYQVEGQIGLENILDEYLEKLIIITNELKRILKSTGVMFWNHGDCYGGSGGGQPNKEKWSKHHPKGEPQLSGMRRPPQGAFNIAGKNPSDLWRIPTQSFPEAHFATFPEKLVEPMILSSCPAWICKKCGKARERIRKQIRTEEKISKSIANKDKGSSRNYGGMRWKSYSETIGWTNCQCNADWQPGIVLDPFSGSGTTCLVAKRLGKKYMGIEINKKYVEIAKKRLNAISGLLF